MNKTVEGQKKTQKGSQHSRLCEAPSRYLFGIVGLESLDGNRVAPGAVPGLEWLDSSVEMVGAQANHLKRVVGSIGHHMSGPAGGAFYRVFHQTVFRPLTVVSLEIFAYETAFFFEQGFAKIGVLVEKT